MALISRVGEDEQHPGKAREVDGQSFIHLNYLFEVSVIAFGLRLPDHEVHQWIYQPAKNVLRPEKNAGITWKDQVFPTADALDD